MPSIDFSNVKRQHVRSACKEAVSAGIPPKRNAKSAFLVFEGHQVPAKYILSLAYERATGTKLGPEAHTGGASAANVLRKLGFTVRFRTSAGRRTARASANAGRIQSSKGATKFVVATACVEGMPARSSNENASRIGLLHAVVAELAERRPRPNVLVLPGGYFHLPVHVGQRSYSARVKAIEAQHFSRACTEASGALGGTIVAGVDSVDLRRRGYSHPDLYDQLCVAWDGSSVIGLGRKVFPTSGEAEYFTVYSDDLSADTRLARLRGGRKALLCSCYDMFGVNESAAAQGTRSKNIRWLENGDREIVGRDEDRQQLRQLVTEGLSGWERLVLRADVGLAAIHHFTRTGAGSGKAYWHRHGVEQASRFVRGRMTFGAAHLEAPLPKPTVALFAARDGTSISPESCFIASSRNELRALVRIFHC